MQHGGPPASRLLTPAILSFACWCDVTWAHVVVCCQHDKAACWSGTFSLSASKLRVFEQNAAFGSKLKINSSLGLCLHGKHLGRGSLVGSALARRCQQAFAHASLGAFSYDTPRLTPFSLLWGWLVLGLLLLGAASRTPGRRLAGRPPPEPAHVARAVTRPSAPRANGKAKVARRCAASHQHLVFDGATHVDEALLAGAGATRHAAAHKRPRWTQRAFYKRTLAMAGK